MASPDREARRKAVGNLLKLAGKAMGDRLERRRPKPPEPEKKPEEEELGADDVEALIGFYEGNGRGTEV